MATKPKNVKLAKNGVDILNAIRNDASLSFQERVPVATQEDIKNGFFSIKLVFSRF